MNQHRGLTIGKRITLLYAMVTICIGGSAAYFFYHFETQYLSRHLQKQIEMTFIFTTAVAANPIVTEDTATLQKIVDNSTRVGSSIALLKIYNESGKLLAFFEDEKIPRPDRSPPIARDIKISGEKFGSIKIEFNNAGLTQNIQSHVRNMGLFLGGTLLMMIMLIFFWIEKWFIRPIHVAWLYVQDLKEGKTPAHVEIRAAPELKKLVETIILLAQQKFTTEEPALSTTSAEPAVAQESISEPPVKPETFQDATTLNLDAPASTQSSESVAVPSLEEPQPETSAVEVMSSTPESQAVGEVSAPPLSETSATETPITEEVVPTTETPETKEPTEVVSEPAPEVVEQNSEVITQEASQPTPSTPEPETTNPTPESTSTAATDTPESPPEETPPAPEGPAAEAKLESETAPEATKPSVEGVEPVIEEKIAAEKKEEEPKT